MTTQTPDSPSARSAGQKAQDRARLLELIQELAVVRGRVTLSSGQEADYYIDLRRVTLHHEAAPLVGRVMLDQQQIGDQKAADEEEGGHPGNELQ